eukprot:scaffold169058_cov18-Prasinocladus_malaysianus.AAC.2
MEDKPELSRSIINRGSSVKRLCRVARWCAACSRRLVCPRGSGKGVRRSGCPRRGRIGGR